MLQDVLIVQPDPAVAQTIANFFRDRGDRINHVKTLTDAKLHLTHNHPTLTIVDLHLFENGEGNDVHSPWFNGSKVLFTSRYPVPDREAQFKEYGAITFLRQPFTRRRLEEALQTLNEANAPKAWDAQPLPRIKVPMRFKIIFPYVILALMLAMVAAYLISQLVLDTIEERFTNQVIEMGKITSDWMVKEENELLATLRLLANTQGLAEAISSDDADTLRRMTLPIAINYGEESIEILNNQGVSILSMRQQPGGNLEDYNFSRGANLFPEWTFVDNVLQQQFDDNGDKFAGVSEAPWGRYFYVAGPVFDGAGKQVGTILIGKSLQTLVRQIRQDTLAHTTIYDFDGQPLASTLPAFQDSLEPVDNTQLQQVIERQDTDSLIRPVAVSSVRYSEILGPWEARSGEDLGVVGASLAQQFLVRPSQVRLAQIFLLVTISFLGVVAVGILLARQITDPLMRMVRASGQVADGNLDVIVEPSGNDEISVLAHSFNQMVSGLREGSIYRDLLGRTVSPEVREQLRQTFAAGDLRIEGQNALATVLMTDVRNFTAMAEAEDPTTILTWLNEYFGELVPIVMAHSGVVSKFDGDAFLAFFGILPRPLPAQESAYLACQAGLKMLEAIERANTRRVAEGIAPFRMGIGINTGEVIAGGLGAADRVQYTIIGDTVNTTQRLESHTKNFGASSIVVSVHTVEALGNRRTDFKLDSLGACTFKGKSEPLEIYRLWPVRSEAGRVDFG